MCIFTEEVQRVSDTNIFARARGDRQLLVYGMRYAAASDLAMVLAIPVPAGCGPEAVQFHAMDDCPDFFHHLQAGFRGAAESIGDLSGVETETATLRVHSVGSYEASFVPSPGDFGRLDPRFRLPPEVWADLRNYDDWGFAVFKLKPTALAAVHPMAFEFPRRDPARLFFPTVHVHNRHVEAVSLFDHTLFCQVEPAMNWHLQQWDDSGQPASAFVRCPQGLAMIDGAEPCWRAMLDGVRENRDTWLGAGESLPARMA